MFGVMLMVLVDVLRMGIASEIWLPLPPGVFLPPGWMLPLKYTPT